MYSLVLSCMIEFYNNLEVFDSLNDYYFLNYAQKNVIYVYFDHDIRNHIRHFFYIPFWQSISFFLVFSI